MYLTGAELASGSIYSTKHLATILGLLLHHGWNGPQIEIQHCVPLNSNWQQQQATTTTEILFHFTECFDMCGRNNVRQNLWNALSHTCTFLVAGGGGGNWAKIVLLSVELCTSMPFMVIAISFFIRFLCRLLNITLVITELHCCVGLWQKRYRMEVWPVFYHVFISGGEGEGSSMSTRT